MARVNYLVKICESCGIEFRTLVSESRFCTISCSKKGNRNRNWKGGIKSKICPTCGNEFMPDGHITRGQTYCSRKCGKIKELNPNWEGKVAVTGANHPFWKGDGVGIDALHTYIRKLLPKPQKCQCCNNAPPIDLANISNEYKRDLSDWEWLCRRCHMRKDGRLKQLRDNGLKANRKLARKNVLKECLNCKNQFKARKKSIYCSCGCSAEYRHSQFIKWGKSAQILS